ncbi:cell division protein DedD [Aliiglaciecola sp. 3_MG-2023]|uniref:cell division protein DedD n=1 Tax=Aliiglaciecola sp. 3_MG-2023 TaxID=3062644 RepID=UPI0026E46A44|nr:cell division protein DedD [Aliiglaciecola sp. 3_MG-2023]MDO6695302.1 cell division protein DedD [Aliiglaciecola sp. 3_MG-2023]
MSSALQNRLVGTIIVVALAVIFLPDLLDGEKQTSQDQFESIPEQPKMSNVSNTEEFPVEQVKQEVSRKVEIVPDVATDDFEIDQVEQNDDPSSTVKQQDVVSNTTSENTDANKNTSREIDRPVEDKVEINNNAQSNPSQIDSRLLAKAGWVVQLGVFRHQKNVSELLSTLRKAGYQAFSRPVQTSSGELTKVFVGPELNKQKLQNALPQLRELTKLQGRVTPFTVK